MSTYLEGIHHIRISQRGYPRSIHNCTARQIDHRHNYTRIPFYGCGIHLLAAIWSSVTHLLLHPARAIITNQANQPEEQQPAKIFPTEEPRPIPPSTSENQHPAHKVHHTFSIKEEMKNYNELRKLLDRN